MKRFAVLGTFLSFGVLGLLCLESCAWIRDAQYRRFSSEEPFYKIPVPVFSNIVMLRNDRYGKGAFGVSRNGGRKHKGLDLLAAMGQPVKASKSGRVGFAGEDKKGYGWYVILRHPDGLQSRYAHLSAVHVSSGQWVDAGQILGLVGKSGNADSPSIKPHLHYEIRTHDDIALDPSKGLLDPSTQIR